MSETDSKDFRVLVVASFGKDATLVRSVLEQSGIESLPVDSIQGFTEAFQQGAGAAILAEEELRGETIAVISEQLAQQPRWSDFPIIVLTGGGVSTTDSQLAVRSRAPLGNVSLLERPLRPATLISSVRAALSARARQYEIRDHLQQRKKAEQELQKAHDALEGLVEERTAALRRLSARLLRVQDEERRRIARELHDSLGQYLTAAKLNLGVLARKRAEDSAPLAEAEQLIDRAIADMRTLSHLLHPPLLDEAGFLSAARWYVEGFGRRSSIVTRLNVPEEIERLPSEVETALFRLLQEALTNVHRHSGTPGVEVTFTVDPQKAILTVQDHGKGIQKEVLDRFRSNGTSVGVGLAGMRERVKELGGSLKIESGPEGTLLRAVIPLNNRVKSGATTRRHASETFLFSASSQPA